MTAAVNEFSTRGELLQRAEAAVQADDRTLFSLRRALPVVGWSIALTIVAFIDVDSSGIAESALFAGLGLLWWAVARLSPGRLVVRHLAGAILTLVIGVAALPLLDDLSPDAGQAAFLVVWAAITIGMIVASWRYVSESHELLRSADTWMAARRDPAHRGLEHGDLSPEVATVHDIRDRPDFDSAVTQLVARQSGRQYSFDTLKPILLLTVTGVMGLVLALAAAFSFDDRRFAWASGLCGLLIVAPYGWAVLGNLRSVISRRQNEANRVTVEARLYGVGRELASGLTVRPVRRPSLLGTPGGMVLLVGWAGVLAIRLRTSSGVAIVIAVAIVLAVAAYFLTLSLIRSRQNRVYPLAGRGPSVLQEPARQITLELTGDSLHIADAAGRAEPLTVPIADIVAVEPVSGLSALTRTGVGIVTQDAPIVLAGSRVGDDPAIVELRSRLTAPPD